MIKRKYWAEEPSNASQLSYSKNSPLYYSALLGIFLLLALRIWVWQASQFAGEDAYITLRYARNIALGNGFVFNIGERVLGTTTPLYTLWLALGIKLGIDAMTFARLTNVCAEVLTAVVLLKWIRKDDLKHQLTSLIAVFLFASSTLPITVAISGMETPVVTLGCLVFWSAIAWNKPLLLCLCAAALILLRIDTLLVVLLGVCLAISRGQRFSTRDISSFLIPVMSWGGWSWWYFNSPIPNSIRAKMWAYSGQMYPAGRSDWETITEAFGNKLQGSLTLLFAIGALILFREFVSFWRRDGVRAALKGDDAVPLVAIVWFILYFAALLAAAKPIFYWYATVPWPIYVWGAAYGLACWGIFLKRTFIKRSISRSSFIGSIVALSFVFSFFGFWNTQRTIPGLQRSQHFDDDVTKPMSRWLAAQMRDNERVMLEPIGYTGYFSGERILDLIGLVSPEVEVSYRKTDFMADIVRRQRPQWLCLRPEEVQRIGSQDPKALNPYRKVKTVRKSEGSPDVAFYIFHRQSL